MWRTDYDSVGKRKTYYTDIAKPSCMRDILKYMNCEIGNQLQSVAGYRDHVAVNDIIWMVGRVEFVATGHGGHR